MNGSAENNNFRSRISIANHSNPTAIEALEMAVGMRRSKWP